MEWILCRLYRELHRQLCDRLHRQLCDRLHRYQDNII